MSAFVLIIAIATCIIIVVGSAIYFAREEKENAACAECVGGDAGVCNCDECEVDGAQREKLDKIMQLLAQSPEQKITNNDVERALGVSDATATRYLAELEARGTLRQVGTEGRGVYYTKR